MALEVVTAVSWVTECGARVEVAFSAGDCWTIWPCLARGERGHGGQRDEEHNGVQGNVDAYRACWGMMNILSSGWYLSAD